MSARYPHRATDRGTRCPFVSTRMDQMDGLGHGGSFGPATIIAAEQPARARHPQVPVDLDRLRTRRRPPPIEAMYRARRGG